YVEAEFENMDPAARKNIAISCPSPKKLSAAPFDILHEVESADTNGFGCKFGPRSKGNRLANHIFLIDVAKDELPALRHPCCDHQKVDFSCGSYTGILPHDAESHPDDRIFVHHKFTCGANDKNVCTLDSPTVHHLERTQEKQPKRKNTQEGGYISKN